MTHPLFLRLATGVFTTLLAGNAAADEDPWFTHVGIAQVIFSEKVDLQAGGAPVPGAGAHAQDNTAFVIEAGYRFTPSWSANATFGAPPTSEVTGTGTAAPLGSLGKVTYAPLVLNVQYRFGMLGPVQPYVGGGAVHYMVLASKDGAIQQLNASSGWGSALQLGLEVPVAKHFNVFLDLKKMFVQTTATGVLPAAGGAVVRAKTKLDPLVVHAGVGLSF